MEHLKLFSKRINIPRLIRSCEEQQHWRELTFLYIAYDEYDNAAATMMEHAEAWDHAQFKEVRTAVLCCVTILAGHSIALPCTGWLHAQCVHTTTSCGFH